MAKKVDRVAVFFAVIAVLSLFPPGFIYFKKMRIVASSSISAGTCLGVYWYIYLVGCIVLLALQFVPVKWKSLLQGILSGTLLSSVFYFVSYALEWMPLDKTEYSRLSIGPAMWLWMVCLIALIVRATERNPWPRLNVVFYFLPVVILLGLLLAGQLDGLAIMKEYHTNREQFGENVVRHVQIAGSVLAAGVILGIPLGYLCNRNRILEKIIFGIINITETIPGISFIGLLIIPLAFLASTFPLLKELGIRGYGVAPAFIALLFYALFPIIHSTRAAFKTMDPYYIEVAQAMGMSARRIFFQVQIPLALPTILSGVRIAMIHSIGGTSLAAFIGGGGLGLYMIQTESMDLVLLGAIPVIIMTFIADKGVKWIISLLPVKVS